MIYRNKRDSEAWLRERTVESLKENDYLIEGDIVLVAKNNCFYKIVPSKTPIELKNKLFAQIMPGEIIGNISTAEKIKNKRAIKLTGDVTGQVEFDGSENVEIKSTVGDDSHTHSNDTIKNLDAAKINSGILSAERIPNLDAKKIATGVLAAERIPNLDASKIVSGTISIDRIPAAALERLVEVDDDTARFKLTKEQIQLGDVVKVKNTLKMYKVINDNSLNTEAGYAVFVAGRAAEVPWSGVTDKPNTFKPEKHTHPDLVSKAGDKMTGELELPIVYLRGNSDPSIYIFDEPGTVKGRIGYEASTDSVQIGYNETNQFVRIFKDKTTIDAPNLKTKSKEVIEAINDLNSSKANVSHAHEPSQINQNASNRFVTDDEKRIWNGKANASHTHDASQIVQNAKNRFVTDDEKVTWNGKANVHDHPYLPLAGGRLGNNAEIRGTMAENDYWFIRGMGTNDDGYFEIGTGDNGNEPIYVRQYNFDSNNSTHSITLMDANGNQAFNAVNASGTVTCSDCITTSDERLKKDIVKIDNALDKVNQLNGYTFLKDGDQQRTTGVLAQELLRVLPEAVFQREDGYYAVSYGNVVGLLIEAIKELQGEIKRLKGDN